MCELDVNIYNLLIVGSVFIGTTFGLLLFWTKRINKKANQLLGLVTFIIVLWNIWILSLDFQIHHHIPFFYLLPLNYSLALGPLLYLYVKKITDFSHQFSKKEALYFLPVSIECIVHLMISRDAWTNHITAVETDTFLLLMPIVQFAAIVSVVVYCVYALQEIRKYHTWLQKNYSENEAYNLRWLYRLIIIFAVLWLLWGPYTIIDYTVYHFQLGIDDYYPIYVLLSMITIWISAEAFLRPEVILLEANRKKDREKEKPSIQILEKASWLQEQMQMNRFYLDPSLTLRSLANNLEIHPNILSKIINDGLGKNFSDFINEYRVNAIVEKLHSGHYDHITLLGISLECGFNSKTTFNRVFKNIMGVTPLQYKKSIKRS